MTGRQLRVAMIIQSYLPRIGGAERQLAALAPLLEERNVSVEIYTRRYPGMKAREKVAGVPVFRAPIPQFPPPAGKAAASLAYTLYTLKILRQRRPDVIHAHELLSPATTALLAHRLWGTPVVAKVLRGGELGDIQKLYSRLRGRRRLAALRQHLAAFIIISTEIDAELASAGVSEHQRVFIPNGVDTDRYLPAAPAERQRLRSALAAPDGPVAVYSGRLVPEKQVELLLAAWPVVRAAHPNATLVVLGSGSEEERLRAMAGDGVRLMGRVDDVVPTLQASDIFVLPSATEGLSNALLEAMATGLAPVATAVGGAPDLIAPGENGLLVRPGDQDALVRAIVDLFADPAWRTALGQAARERVKAEYSLVHVADRLRQLYERVVAWQDRRDHA